MEDPRRQYLAVDALVIYLLAVVIGFFINVSRIPDILAVEWVSLAGNCIVCGLLLFYRSRESELRGQPGAPREAREAAKELIRSLRELIDGRKRKPPAAPQEPVAPQPPPEPPQ